MRDVFSFKMPLASRIHGCWLGKSIGGTLGLPAEGRMERMNFSYYDPVPTVVPPNDDLELQLVWLHMAEQGHGQIAAKDFASAWLRHIHYMWDEYGRCRWNLRRGVPLGNVGTFENSFHAGMGSPIRSEIWACLFAGDPDSAASYAALDASMDHGLEGIAGEVLFAVMQSDVAAGAPLARAIDQGLGYIPSTCECARAVQFVRAASRAGKSAWDCWKELLVRHGHENFTHAPLNVALTIWALLYGEENFEKSILLAVNAGYDTDCTAATVGATLGLLFGAEGIPKLWSDPIGEGVSVGVGIQSIDAPKTLEELTQRTAALVGKLERKTWLAPWAQILPPVKLESLPGTIRLEPFGGNAISWANGELPPEVKRAGGAVWSWEVPEFSPRHLICLARNGARLFMDETLVVDCPPELPYVPATHRCPAKAITLIEPAPGKHEMRLELATNEMAQDASVILCYPNFHICPWTSQELPHAAELPTT